MSDLVERAKSYGCKFKSTNDGTECYWLYGGRNSNDHYAKTFTTFEKAAKHFLEDSREGLRAQILRANAAFNACEKLLQMRDPNINHNAALRDAIEMARIAVAQREVNQEPTMPAKKRYRVRLTRITHDVVQGFVTVEAADLTEAYLTAEIEAREADIEWQWKDSLPFDDDLEIHEATEI